MFVGRSTLAGTAGLLGLRPERVAAEPPPETTRIRVVRSGAICISPLYIAEELFRLEGFTDVEYVQFKTGNPFTQAVGAGQVDLARNFIGPLVVSVDERAPVVILAGVHAGCFELFGSERVRSIRDLKRSSRPCSTRAGICVPSARCIGSWPHTPRCGSGARSSGIPSMRPRSCWPSGPTSSGAGTSPSCSGPRSGPTSGETPADYPAR